MKYSADPSLILCVDDESSGLLMRRLLLESQGYRVLTADSGEQGLAMLSAQAIDLILLDYMMPGEDGGMVAEKMRKIRPAIPILMLTAYVDLPSETLAHVDRYVIKGQSPADLLRAVAEMLHAAGASRPGPAL
jgi:CheY-like chemotaxis protein